MDYKFRTKAQAKRFVKILGTDPVIDGGEEAAMVLFKLKPKKKRKAALSVEKYFTASSKEHSTGDNEAVGVGAKGKKEKKSKKDKKRESQE